MAKKIQKKISAALNHKKKREQYAPENTIKEWQTVLNNSPFASIIPSLQSLDIENVPYENATPQILQELFLTIITKLKNNYFNQEHNRNKLAHHINMISDLLNTSHEQMHNKIIGQYFNMNEIVITLLFINNQMALAVKFSKLMINVINRQIKDTMGFANNIVDNDNILKQLNDLTELCPELSRTSSEWFQDEIRNHFLTSNFLTDTLTNLQLHDFPEPPLDLVDNYSRTYSDEDFNNDLTNALSSVGSTFDNALLSHAAQTKPIQNLTSNTLKQNNIRKAYRKMHNLIARNLVISDSMINKRLHQFIVEAINHALLEQGQFMTHHVNRICKRYVKEQVNVIALSKAIKNQRIAIKSFLTELDKLPKSNETEILASFLNKKVQSTLYFKIRNALNKVVQENRYLSYKSYTINVIQYMKILLTQPVYESGMLVQLKFDNPDIILPFSIELLSEIKKHVIRVNKYSSKKSIKRECSYLLHTLIFDEELSQQLQKIQALHNADFTPVISKILMPYDNQELLNLARDVNNSTLASPQLDELLKSESLSSMNFELIKYEQYVRALGKLHLAAIQHPEDDDLRKRIDEIYKNINDSFSKLQVIIDLIAITQMIPEESMSQGVAEVIGNIKEDLDEISLSFVKLNNVALEFAHKNVDPKDIFLRRIIRGDFFHIKDQALLENAAMAMLNSVPPIALLDGIIQQFEKYNPEQQQACLTFYENYIASDNSQMLFSAVNPKESAFYKKLEQFINLVNNAGLSTHHLTKLSEKNIAASILRFNGSLKALQENISTKEQLIRRINTICDKINRNVFNLTKLDEYLEEILNIINAENFSNFTSLEQSKLLTVFNQLKEESSNLSFHKGAFEKVRKNLNVALVKKSAIQPPSNEVFSQKKLVNQSSILEVIKNTVEDDSNIAFYDKIVIKFINSIEAEFANLFTQIDLNELRDLNWTLDSQREIEELNPNAPHVKEYHENLELASQFTSLLILYHIDSNQVPKQHHDLQQVKQYYQFVEKALVQALEMKALTTAYILYKTVQSNPIKRLGLASSMAESTYLSYLSKSKEAQVKISDLLRDKGALPLLPFILQKLIFAYKKQYGSQFEKLGGVGRVLTYFVNKKEHIKSIGYPQDKVLPEMRLFLIRLNVFSAENSKLDNFKIQRLLLETSNNIKPDVSTKYAISDFKSVGGLVKHLKVCRSRSIDYQFKMLNPEKELFDWVLASIKADTKFIQFSDSIEALFLMNEINYSQKRNYKRFNSDLILILTYYQNQIARILQLKDDKNKSNLELFFSQFNKLKRIRDIKESEKGTFELFSQLQTQKQLIQKIDNQYTFYIRMLEQLEKHRSQTAYSQLLEDVLSGNAKKSMTLPTERETYRQANNQNLLPDNEYDIPSAEPEHPDRIGINRTMSFSPNEQASVLALFNTDELKAEFLNAFPWAVHIDNLDKLNKMQFNPSVNLLGTPRLFALELQLATIKFVLIAMDSLGKVAGYSGELTIQNFDRINDIINQLKWLTGELKAPDVNEIQLLEQVQAVIPEMAFHNQEYFDMQQLYNPPFRVEGNPNMNGFCHLNEHLAYELSGVNYEDSLLAPATPSSPYLEKMSLVTINHDKT